MSRPEPISLRLTPELRALLDEAVKKGGRSLNAEIKMRLQKSFDDEVPNFTAQEFAERSDVDQLQRDVEALRAEVRELARKVSG